MTPEAVQQIDPVAETRRRYSCAGIRRLTCFGIHQAIAKPALSLVDTRGQKRPVMMLSVASGQHPDQPTQALLVTRVGRSTL
jgi:hypothetical protein